MQGRKEESCRAKNPLYGDYETWAAIFLHFFEFIYES